MIVTSTLTLPKYAVTKVLGYVDGSAMCVADSASPTTVMGIPTREDVDRRQSVVSHPNQMPNSINDAIDDMIRRAEGMGADAIIG